MEQSSLLWSHLGILNRERYQAIMEVYGSLDKATEHLGPELLKSLGCKQDTIERLMVLLEKFDQAKAQKVLGDQNITFITLGDPQYPKLLSETADPPIFLYAKGDLSILNQPCLALVGTRQMSAYGRRVTESFVEPIVRNGIVTVSGLAQGVDTIVAMETLKAGGKTVAILAHGLQAIYPPGNTKLAEKIVEAGGLILTEEAIGVEGDLFRFPKRNRIIAGLSMGTVVLEAPEGSGALITARHAIDESRDVFVVPGQIFDAQYAGSHKFLSSGQAKLVTSAEDILSELGVHISKSSNTPSLFEPESPAEKAIYNVLTSMPQPVDELVTRAKLPASEIVSTLTLLELTGAAKNVGNGMWVRS